MNFTEKAKEIHEQNKLVGWWDDPNRCILTVLQLVSTEIAEATEGERKNLMDDHLPHRRMGEVELADALIRTLDIAGKFEFYITFSDMQVMRYAEELQQEGLSVAACHALITSEIGDAITIYHRYNRGEILEENINDIVIMIMTTGAMFQYDIVGAMEEKLEYNRHLAYHKLENRALQNGKKF